MQKRRLHLSRTDKKIAGVCGGFAEYFNFDPTLIRIIWVLITLMSSWSGLGILMYIVCWAVLPSDDGYQDMQ
ncbi:MAG: PspC domain-containing protein [Epulopiscium sp.]|nr:PspC domain-containing protein [Candidatus Epulonipiscium sp.]